MCACGWREIIVIMVIMPQIIIGKTRRIISKYFRVEKGVDIFVIKKYHMTPLYPWELYMIRKNSGLLFSLS